MLTEESTSHSAEELGSGTTSQKGQPDKEEVKGAPGGGNGISKCQGPLDYSELIMGQAVC